MKGLSFQQCQEHSTEDCIVHGVQAYLGGVHVKVFIWISSTIIFFNGQIFPIQGKRHFHDVKHKGVLELQQLSS